jgi:hypothetical protein
VSYGAVQEWDSDSAILAQRTAKRTPSLSRFGWTDITDRAGAKSAPIKAQSSVQQVSDASNVSTSTPADLGSAAMHGLNGYMGQNNDAAAVANMQHAMYSMPHQVRPLIFSIPRCFVRKLQASYSPTTHDCL